MHRYLAVTSIVVVALVVSCCSAVADEYGPKKLMNDLWMQHPVLPLVQNPVAIANQAVIRDQLCAKAKNDCITVAAWESIYGICPSSKDPNLALIFSNNTFSPVLPDVRVNIDLIVAGLLKSCGNSVDYLALATWYDGEYYQSAAKACYSTYSDCLSMVPNVFMIIPGK